MRLAIDTHRIALNLRARLMDGSLLILAAAVLILLASTASGS